MNNSMTAAEAVVDALIDEGVEVVFEYIKAEPKAEPKADDSKDEAEATPVPKKATRKVSPYVNFKNDTAKKAEIEEMMESDGIEVNKGTYGKACRTAWAALSAEEQNGFKTE